PPGPSPGVLIAVLIVWGLFGGALCALCWMVFLNALEHVEADADGLTHKRPGRSDQRLTWGQIAGIRMQGFPSRLVLLGRSTEPAIKVRACLTGYDRLLDYLQTKLDWERLIRAGDQPAGADAFAEGAGDVPILPAEYPRRGALLLPTFGLGLAILLGG